VPEPRPEVLDFLQTRRSRPYKTLKAPGPSPSDLEPILTAAARVPDHGKLEPFRFLVLSRAALDRLESATVARAGELGLSDEDTQKARIQFSMPPLVVAVVASPKPSEKIPEIEQHLAAGCACFSLLNAALAAGWGANWLSAWMAYDRPLIEGELGLDPHEFIAGYIHIGTETATPPERPRPDLDTITSWVDT